jgi:hypothetical protein
MGQVIATFIGSDRFILNFQSQVTQSGADSIVGTRICSVLKQDYFYSEIMDNVPSSRPGDILE